MKFIKRLLFGVLLGIAIIVPGVSGASLAVVFMMYDPIIESISLLFKDFKKSISFLLPIIIGAVMGGLIGFFGVKSLININPLALISLFGGLMLGSISKDNINKVNNKYILIGFIIPLVMNMFSYININSFLELNYSIKNVLYLVVLGVLIAFTQLIPGASATSLLMSLGVFSLLLNSFTFITLPFYLLICVGVMIGILLFSNIINRLINNYKNNMYCVFLGLALSSIIVLFVNKEIIDYYLNFKYIDLICIPIFIFGYYIVRILKKETA